MHTTEKRPDGLPRMGSDDPLCDICVSHGGQKHADIVIQVEDQDSGGAEWYRGCQQHRREIISFAATTPLHNPKFSYYDPMKDDSEWVPLEDADALCALATTPT